MIVSHFSQIFDTLPKATEYTWPQFVERFGQHLEAESKESVPVISPAQWPKGARRKKGDVQNIHFAALDLDKVSQSDIDQVKNILEPYSYLLHTTWSHAQTYQTSHLWSVRVFIDLSRPVKAAEWPKFWQGLNNFFGGILDPSCKDPGRLYFVPSIPVGTAASNFAEYQEKQPLDVEKIMAYTNNKQAQSSARVDQTQLLTFAGSLLRRKSDYHKEMGELLKKVCRGEIFAKPGERDTTLFKLCSLLAEKWPYADSLSLARHFGPSLYAMSKVDGEAPSIEDAQDKIARKQQEFLAKSPGDASTSNYDDLDSLILDAFIGKRSTPYTEAEIEEFAKAAKTTKKHFRRRWIVQKGNFYYMFKDGQYSHAYCGKEFVNAAIRDLAPAHTAGVSCFKSGARGAMTVKSERELMLEYGIVAKKVVADMTAQKSYFDWENETIVEAVSPLRPLKPAFSERVDQYLRALGGKEQERLIDWVSVVTNNNQLCAALFLHGVKGAGKGLLVSGLARLWRTEGPTILKDVFGDFNDSLAHCPLVLADEKLPSHFKNDGNSADLRAFIQERSRPLRRKYQPHGDLLGATRLIIAANNTDILNHKSENLTNEDIGAIHDRILYIYAGQNSHNYLASLSQKQRENLVDNDEIARHALWLRDNHTFESNGRFMVTGSDSTFHKTLMTGSYARSPVLHWMTGYIQDPGRLDSDGDMLVRISNNQLLVNVKGMVENWELYTTNTEKRFATSDKISKALSALSAGKKKQLKNGKGVPTNYWPIRTEYLLNWNQDNEYASEAEILGALGMPTKEAA